MSGSSTFWPRVIPGLPFPPPRLRSLDVSNSYPSVLITQQIMHFVFKVPVSFGFPLPRLADTTSPRFSTTCLLYAAGLSAGKGSEWAFGLDVCASRPLIRVLTPGVPGLMVWEVVCRKLLADRAIEVRYLLSLRFCRLPFTS
jgi:hypothetical protein